MSERDWKKRPLFLQWVEDAKVEIARRGGKGTKIEVAEIMGLAPNSMKKYTAKEATAHKPSSEALRRLGEYLHRDYRLLFDGPDEPPAGIDPKDWSEASEDSRNFTVKMFYRGRTLSRAQMDAVDMMIMAGHTMGRERKAREAGEKKAGRKP